MDKNNNDEIEVRLKNFIKWCDDRGITLKDVELRYSGPESGYGLFAQKFIRSNECFLEVRF